MVVCTWLTMAIWAASSSRPVICGCTPRRSKSGTGSKATARPLWDGVVPGRNKLGQASVLGARARWVARGDGAVVATRQANERKHQLLLLTDTCHSLQPCRPRLLVRTDPQLGGPARGDACSGPVLVHDQVVILARTNPLQITPPRLCPTPF